MGVTLAPGISHRPGSSSENIIQPVVDATGLILRPFSNGQSAAVFQVQNVDGTAVHFGLTPDGEIELSGGVGTNGQVLTSAGAGNPVEWSTPSGGDLSSAVILAPNSMDRNLIQPTADGNKGVVVRSHSATQSAHLIEAQHPDGTSCFFVDKNACVTAVDATQADLDAFNNDWGYNQDNLSAFGPGGAFVDFIGFTNGPNPCVSNLQFFAVNRSAPNGSRVANPFSIQSGATVANDGTVSNRIWKLVSGANTLIDCGSNAIAFLGANAAVRQTLPAAATDPASTQALGNALRSLAITFGLAN